MNFTDQINHSFKLDSVPKRIISLVPSQTELLYDLGLDEKVVGITKFCIHPKKWFESKNRVGGTKNLNFEKIATLKPDLIIANKEENTQLEIEKLQKIYSVYTSDIANLEDSITMIQAIGEITLKQNEAKKIIEIIEVDFENLKPFSLTENKVLYLIWKSPYMSIGGNTFINDMLKRCGFDNVIAKKNDYPEVTAVEIKALNPNLIFLSSEPYPFLKKHIKELKKICPNSKIMLVDGEYFSWYGSRLKKAVNYFAHLYTEIA